MNAVTLTKTPAKPTPTCPDWCTDPHDHDTADYRAHYGTAAQSTHRLYGNISWLEPLTERARYLGSEPRIHLAVGDANVHQLSPRQATGMAAVMAELGQLDAAELLREMVALTGGAR